MKRLIIDDGLSPAKDFNKNNNNLKEKTMKKFISHTIKNYFGTKTKKNSKSKRKFIEQHELEWMIEGAEFRILRKLCNLTLHELSEKTGASSSTLSKFERGHAVRNSKILKKIYLE